MKKNIAFGIGAGIALIALSAAAYFKREELKEVIDEASQKIMKKVDDLKAALKKE